MPHWSLITLRINSRLVPEALFRDRGSAELDLATECPSPAVGHSPGLQVSNGEKRMLTDNSHASIARNQEQGGGQLNA
jgi:hypothetical protein